MYQIKKIIKTTQQNLNSPLPEIIVKIDCSHALSPRNFAAIQAGDPTIIYLCEDLADQPTHRIKGILWHEMGHILQWLKKTKPPENLDYEQQADFLVESVCGVKIYYDEDLIQTVDPRIGVIKERPRGLK
jgi:hypothetical protein